MAVSRTRDLRSLVNKASRSRCVRHPALALLVLEGEITCKSCNGSDQRLEIETIPSETEKFMTGNTQSAAIQSKLSQKYGVEMTTHSEVTDVALIQPSDNQIAEVGKKFSEQIEGFGKQLSEGDLVVAAQLSIAGFQHFHFNVIQGGLYLNLRGREFNARRMMGNRFGGVTTEIITDKTIQQAVGLAEGEILVKATLHENVGDRTIIAMEDYGRAGGPRDAKQPVAKANTLEMALARAKCRVLIAGAPLGVPIGSYAEEVGMVVTSDGEAQVAALTEGDAPEGVDVDTGEVQAASNQTADKRAELVERLSANDIGKEELEASGIDVFAMLRSGSEPHEVADFVSQQLSASTNEAEDVQANQEDVETLPW